MARLPLPVPAGPLLAMLVAAVPAQDEVLTVEKRTDLAGRNRLAAALADIRVDFTVEEVSPKSLCRYLGSLTGDEINFLFRDPDGETATIEPVALRLKNVSVMDAMGAIQTVTGLRFVYRSGIVFLTPAGRVRPMTYLVMYDLRGPTRPIRNFPGPELGLPFGEERVLFPEEEEPSTTVSGFTAENVEDLLRTHVTPEAWDAGGVSMSNADGLFVIRHTIAGHRQIRAVLHRMGVLPAPRLVARRPAPRVPLLRR